MSSTRKDSEHPLKAVVFADYCDSARRPALSDGKPLCNTSILTWQLLTLARFGVQHAIILSSEPIHDIYVDPLDRLQLSQLSSSSWESQGDALRDLEGRDDLRPVDDFIIVHPNTVFNLNVSALVTAHRNRRQADPNWLVTAVFRRNAGTVRTGLTIAVDASTNTLVKYSTTVPNEGLSLDITSEHANLQAGTRVDVFHDVLDIGLDVCAPELLVEFRENFYFSRIRSYIEEKLDGGEADVLGNRVYVHFIDSKHAEYATRVNNLAMLAQATSDVLNGWMLPITPPRRDTSAPHSASDGAEQGNYVPDRTVFGQDVSIGVGASISECSIGHHVTIGNDVTLSQSIIGDGCIIGDQCVLSRCILDEDCHIQNECVVPSRCFFDTGVRVGHELFPIDSHTLVTTRDPAAFYVDTTDSEEDDTDNWYDTHESSTADRDHEHHKTPAAESEKAPSKLLETMVADTSAEEGTNAAAQAVETDASMGEVVGAHPAENDSSVHENGTDDDADDSEIVVNEEKPAGMQGADGDAPVDDVSVFMVKGSVIPAAVARSTDPFFQDRLIEQEYFSDSVDELESDNEDDDDEEVENSTRIKTGGRSADKKGASGVALNGRSVDISKSLASLALHDRQLEAFTREVLETIERSFDEEVDIENTALELKGLKLSYDCSFTETFSRVLAGLILSLSRRNQEDELYASMVKTVLKYKPVLEKYIVKDNPKHDQQVVQDIAEIVGGDSATAVMYMLKVLYDKDLMDEDGILAWGREEKARVELGHGSPQMSNTLQPFLDWLEEEDDDSDDADDGDGSDYRQDNNDDE